MTRQSGLSDSSVAKCCSFFIIGEWEKLAELLDLFFAYVCPLDPEAREIEKKKELNGAVRGIRVTTRREEVRQKRI